MVMELQDDMGAAAKKTPAPPKAVNVVRPVKQSQGAKRKRK